MGKSFCGFMFLLDKRLDMKLLGDRVGICLTSSENAKPFPQIVVPCYILTTNGYFTPLPTFKYFHLVK